MNQKIIGFLLTSLIILGVSGCSSNSEQTKGKTKTEGYIPFTYVFDDGITKEKVKVEASPERAVTLSQFMTEMLLALGLEDQMVGTALLDNPVLPEYKKAYDKIPVLELTEGHAISKESFVALNPDFVGGWDVSFTEQSTGTSKDLIKNQIAPFVPKSIMPDATIETVYEDFRTLGKIFNVEKRAEQVISKMEKEIEAVQNEINRDGKKPRVMVYDSGTKEAMVVGTGLANELITLAGGDNIYKNSKKSYDRVSFESIIKENPDVIIVIDYFAAESAKEKIKFLKEHPALKNVNAVKNNVFGVVGLADLSPGVRNAKVIQNMHDVFYK